MSIRNPDPTTLTGRARRLALAAALLWVAQVIALVVVVVAAPRLLGSPLAIVLLAALVASMALGVAGLVAAVRAVRAEGWAGRPFDLNARSTKTAISAGSSAIAAALLFALTLTLALLTRTS
jgi:hypothetical protein